MDTDMIIVLVLKVVGLAMGIVSIVLGFFPKVTKYKDPNYHSGHRVGGYGTGSFTIAMVFQPLGSYFYFVAA